MNGRVKTLKKNKGQQRVSVLHIATVDLSVKKILIHKLKELQQLGYHVETLSSDTGLTLEIEKEGIHHHTIPISRNISILKDIISIYRVYKFLKNSKYDIVHTHTAKAGFIGRIAARIARVPIVIHTSHGLPFYKGQPFIKYSLFYLLERIASWFSDGYFSQSREDMETIKRMVPNRLVTGYEGNGINLSEINQHTKLSKQRSDELKKAFHIPEETFLFLMAARFEKIKNHQMLIKSLEQLNNQMNVKVMLAGDGPLLNSVMKEVKKKELEKMIIFLGFQNNIPEWLQMADAVILTSEREGLPRIVMEAMAFGTPVLATNVPGTREVVIDGETGELVELNNHNMLAKKIKEWSTHSYNNKLAFYKEKASKHIEENYTESIAAKRIDFYYQHLLSLKDNRWKKDIP